MASFKIFFLLVALFAAAFAVEQVREKKGIAVTGIHGLGGYYDGSVLPYSAHGGFGYPGYLGYHHGYPYSYYGGYGAYPYSYIH